GCINIHASLLPRWRGAAPIQRAIEAGDTESGITIIQMDEGLDTGAMLVRTPCAISATETAETLHDRLADLGATAVLEALSQMAQGSLQPEAQDDAESCYAAKIHKHEADLDFSQPAALLERKVRAFNPWPVARATLNDQLLRIWQASAMSAPCDQPPGTIVHSDRDGIDVATGEGLLRLTRLQRPGGKAVAVSDLFNANATLYAVGKRFATPSA
ncbi:MAG: methionyl-tRNA formyltransferase, partial [Gammaproteobacteria bacterium]|nr:methionyl-tRNA formyltransferase [Gammaproteobacteria bacterium]